MKKGQIAVFMIIAVLLLLIVALAFIYTHRSQPDTDNPVDDLSSLSPLKRFIAQCIDTTAKNALFLVGEQGGYVNLPLEIKNNPDRYISVSRNAPLKTPYWSYGKELFIPEFSVMEAQLSEYISKNISTCLANLSALDTIVDVRSLSDPVASVHINEKDISVHLNFTIESGSSAVRSADFFEYSIRINLRELVEAGKQITVEASNQAFFESAVIDMMSAADPKIPMSNILFSCQRPIWREDDVEDFLQNMLYYNVPLVRVKGAEIQPFVATDKVYKAYEGLTPDSFNEKFPYSTAQLPSDIYEHSHFYFDAGIADRFKSSNIKVGFAYLPAYGMDFAVRPSSNGLLKASSGQGERDYLRFVCIQVYHFTYDLHFPIQVSLVKDRAFLDGSSFVLRFAIPVQIQKNLPEKTSFSLRKSFAPTYNAELCNTTHPEMTTIYVEDTTNALQSLEGANVEYFCQKYVCPLGKTQMQSTGRVSLQTHLPSSCFGGTIHATKDGFVAGDAYVGNDRQTFVLSLLPLKAVTYKVMFGENRAGLTSAPLANNQVAYIYVKDMYSNYESYYTYTVDKTNELQALNQLQLIRGTSVYNISILIYEGDLLVGGYMGALNARQTDLSRPLTFHAYEFIPRPTSGDDLVKSWQKLDSKEVSDHYAPSWG